MQFYTSACLYVYLCLRVCFYACLFFLQQQQKLTKVCFIVEKKNTT